MLLPVVARARLERRPDSWYYKKKDVINMVRMVEINDSQFNTLVLKSSLPVLIECSSPECIICKTMAERIQEASKDFLSSMVFFRLNINDNNKWKDFNVRVIPTLLYFKDGILVARQDSFPETQEIRKQINLIAGHDVGTVNVRTERKSPCILRRCKKR